MRNLYLLLFLIPAFASDPVVIQGHPYSRVKRELGLEWSLRGAEHFRYRLFSVFTGALYENADAGARRLVFTYTRALKGQILRDQGMRVLRAAHGDDALARWADPLRRFNEAYGDVRPGDQYTLTVIPARGVWLHLNGHEKAFVADSDFGFWYLTIWLGEKPMSIPLRDALLGRRNS